MTTLPSELPARFGPYLVLGKLGVGGMGTVYRALDPRLQREVAVKVLHRNLEVSGARERFVREARTISSLNHPNICTVFDIGEQDGDPFLVMELLQGESLKERIARGALPEEDVREIAFRVALALQAAHTRGVVHRDIKPANLFLVSDSHGAADVKVLDFGLAKIQADSTDERETAGLTRVGATVGTVEYMSPEQACGEVLDTRSDLFSLGAVLYEMATGRLPFHGATSAIVFSELLNRDPVPPREANLDVSPELDRIIRGLLIKQREKRTPSATALLEALASEPENAPADDSRQVLQPKQQPVAAADLAPAESSRETKKPASEDRAVHPPTVIHYPLHSGRSGSAPVEAASGGSSSHEAKGTIGPNKVSVQREASRPSRPSVEHALVDPVPANHSRRTGETAHITSRVHAMVVHTDDVEAQSPDLVKHSRPWLWVWVLFVSVAVGAGVWLVIRQHAFGNAGEGSYRGPIQVIPLANQTGNAALGRGPTALVELVLGDSPQFVVRHPAPIDILDGGNEGSIAQTREGSVAVLSGFLSHTNDGYLIHLSVKRSDSGAELATVEETVNSLPELSAGLARLVLELRRRLGEDSSSIGMSDPSAPATTNLSALAAFAEADADAELADGAAALQAYTRAVEAAPNFTAARLRLILLLCRLHADEDAEKALEQLSASAPAGGAGLRAMRAYLLAVRAGDGSAAAVAKQWHDDRPMDEDGTAAYVDQLLAENHGNEASAAAAEMVQSNPYRLGNQELLTRAQIESGRPDAAWVTQTKAFRLGVGSPELSLAAAYLKHDGAALASALAQVQGGKSKLRLLLAEAAYRANVGDVPGARTAYTAAAVAAESLPAASSAKRYVLSLQGLNEALAGECRFTERPASPAVGETAILEAVRDGWCRQTPATANPAKAGNAQVRAAGLWATGHVEDALSAWASSRVDAHTALSNLARGRLHALSHQPDEAISDYKAVLTQRGAALLSGTIAYPAALAQLSAAYRSTGDQMNANAQQAALSAVWSAGSTAKVMLTAAGRQP